MSSYQDELTLSVNLTGSSSDRALIVSLLENIDAELPPETRSAHAPERA